MVQGTVASDRLSSALPGQVLGMPSRVQEFEEELEKIERKLEKLNARERAVQELDLGNSFVKRGKDLILIEISDEIKHWAALREFYSRALDNGRVEVPELLKLHAAAAGVSVLNGAR